MLRAVEGVDVAYYLIHSLGTGTSFDQRDRDAAGIFADARSPSTAAMSPAAAARWETLAAASARP